MMSLLLLSAVCVTPAAANWFSRPDAGINLNVGSAPSPTPNDLRIIEGYAGPPAIVRQVVTIEDMRDMEGKTVFGDNGEMLGYILAVDEGARMMEVQLPSGVGVAVGADLFLNEPDRVMAPTLSQTEMLAMARAQTGSTVALNLVVR